MSMRGKTLLKGHSLVGQGKAHDANGIEDYYALDRWGRAKCSCGELSPDLPTRGARKRWHREHKDALR